MRPALISLYALENSGVRHVAAALRGAGMPVVEIYFKDWINNRFPWPTEAEILLLLDLLRAERIDVVGLSVRASAFHRIATHLTRRIRHALPGVRVVWGGMHPTFLPEACIAEADHIAIGEVDEVVAEFFGRLAAPGTDAERTRRVASVPNFWTRDGQHITRNDLALLPDLDRLPRRDFHTHAAKFYIDGPTLRRGDPFVSNPEYTLLASRGCPYWTCTFCSNTVTRPLYDGLGKIFRVRSVAHVIDELRYARRINPHIRVVRFDDEVFPLQARWVGELAAAWRAEVKLPFEILVDPRMVPEAPLRALRDAGLRAVCMGIQANERVNREHYHRDTSNQMIVDAQTVFRRLDIRANFQLIWDDPFSTEADKDQLFRMLLSLPRPFELYLFGLTLYGGTHLARGLERAGRVGPQHIEGHNAHAFDQFRIALDYPRPASERRWLALLVLLNKPFLRKSWIEALYREPRFITRPEPLVALAQACNLAHMSRVVAEMFRDGEMTPLLIRRWANLDSLVTM